MRHRCLLKKGINSTFGSLPIEGPPSANPRSPALRILPKFAWLSSLEVRIQIFRKKEQGQETK